MAENGSESSLVVEGNNSLGETSRSSESEVEEPAKKKFRGEDVIKKEGLLEQRLGGILCCAVCLDLPKAAIYQCTNGHLMCAGCFTHLLADARLRDETATCPNCRVEISKTTSSRNLAVEKAVNELPAECQYCSQTFPRHLLDRHEMDVCCERITTCKFHRIGCPWRGPYHEMVEHQEQCAHPKKSGGDVMDSLVVVDQKRKEELSLYNKIFDLLSFEKITFNDLQLKPYRTDEFIHKLFYETSRFTAFNNHWVVKARVNDNQNDPTQSCERTLSYQLILKTKVSAPISMHFLILKGPFGDMKVHPVVYHFEFSDDKNESPYYKMPLQDSAECNKLLAAKVMESLEIVFREKVQFDVLVVLVACSEGQGGKILVNGAFNCNCLNGCGMFNGLLVEKGYWSGLAKLVRSALQVSDVPGSIAVRPH
ncbi:hypothetical protein CHUAL_013663 [Chamberlinius hualienensis]